MSRLIGRFRMLLPPAPLIVVYILAYLIAALPAILIARNFGAAAVDVQVRRIPIAAHLIGMVIYGLYRAAAFHPVFRPGYRQWLELTPWRWGKPLPVGPAHPVIEDALIVAAAGLPLWLSGDLHPIVSYAMALGAYLLALSLTFAGTGAWGFQFPVLFGVGLAVVLCRGPAGFSGAAVLASYPVAMIGLRRSLRRWPWADVRPLTYDAQRGFVVAAAKALPLGWPHDRLGPRHDPPPKPLDHADKVLHCLLAGWWCYALEQVIAGGEPIYVVVLYVTLFLNIFRLATTVAGHAPPINLFGRIARLRPIIPSYDQVFLTPIAAIFIASAGPWSLARAGVPFSVAIAVSAGLSLLASSLGGPDRRAWQLTARCRITSGIAGSNKAGEYVQTG